MPAHKSPRSLRSRLLLASGASLLLVLLLIAPLLYFSFKDALQRSHDQRLASVMLSLIASVERAGDGRLQQRKPLLDPAFERPASGWYWQIRLPSPPPAQAQLLRSRSLWDRHWPQDSLAPSATPRFHTAADYDGAALRVASQSIVLGADSGPQLDLLVIGELSAVNRAAQGFAVVLALALLLLIAALLAATGLQVRYGLYPLRRIRVELQRIEQQDQHQLQQRYPVELQPLADQVNTLLARNQAVVERARQRTGDLAHALKLPLSRLLAEAQAPAPQSWTLVIDEVQRVRQLLDHHLTLAASGAQGMAQRVLVAPVCAALVQALERIHAARNIRFHCDIDPQLCFRGDPQDLQEMLGNLLDNAGKWARSAVRVRVSAEPPEQLRVQVSDDGPGLPEAALSDAMQRGVRLDQRTPGSGLGLHIVAQLAADYGGELQLGSADEADGGGLRATLRLPGCEPKANVLTPQGRS